MSAVRLARAVTGREQLVKFAGAYHGHVDGLLAEAGSGLATQGIPASPGVTAAQAADDDRRAVERLAARSTPRSPSTSSAAIIAEPMPANMGLVPAGRRASSELLREPRRRARARCSSSTR